MICGFENGTNGCNLAVFDVDVAFACHFVVPINGPHLCRSARDVGYSSENSKMAGNSASYPFNSWCIDRLRISIELHVRGELHASQDLFSFLDTILQIIKIGIPIYF